MSMSASQKNLQPSNAKLSITLNKGLVGTKQFQRDTVRSLGLKRIGHTVERDADAVTVGMINKVKHLVTVEEAK
jgi:large subunit ribosomal protein L30